MTEGAGTTHPAGSGDVVGPTGPAPARRPRRRVVRPGAGDPDPSVRLRAPDDLDVGWHPVPDDADDERLRRDVPPHW